MSRLHHIPRAGLLLLFLLGCGGASASQSDRNTYAGGGEAMEAESMSDDASGGSVTFEDFGSIEVSASSARPDGDFLGELKPQARPQSKAATRQKQKRASGDLASNSGGTGTGSTTHTPTGQNNSVPPEPDRMVYYSGQASLRVTKPEESVQQAVELVEAIDGFVEQRSNQRVTLRVPVDQFQSVFDQLLGLGDVDQHSVSAQDVTDQFSAVELRLRTLVASRERFVALLAKAKTEREKLSLLAQIQRLTEQIDRLQMQRHTLKSLADYSRIQLEFVPRSRMPSGPVHEPVHAFRWIFQLSPFAATRVSDDEEFGAFAVPEGFVVFDDDERWRAESANGAIMWGYIRRNEPKGDSAFWIEAVDHRIRKTYEKGERERIGSFEVLKLEDGSRQNYRFWTAVHAEGDELWLVHIYFPSESHQERFEPAVRAALERGLGGDK